MKEQIILEYIRKNPSSSSKNIHLGLHEFFSYATAKRILKKLQDEGLIVTDGKKRYASYSLSKPYDLFYPVDLNAYLLDEQDERRIKDGFDFGVFEGV